MNLSFEQPLHYGRLHCQGNDFLFRNSQKSKLPDNNQFQPDMRNKTGTGTFKLLDCTVDIEHCRSYIHHSLVQFPSILELASHWAVAFTARFCQYGTRRQDLEPVSG